MTQLAPTTESYLPEPKFKYTPKQQEVDFAQLIACGTDPVHALVTSGLTTSEAATANRARAYRKATQLINTEAIQERIDFFIILHKTSMEITASRILQEGAAMAFVDIAEVQEEVVDEETGKVSLQMVKNLKDLPRHVRAAIKEVYTDKYGQMRYKFHDKLQALKMIGDIEGVFDEANRAKAPQVTVNLDSGASLLSPLDERSSKDTTDNQMIDISPQTSPESNFDEEVDPLS